MSSRKSSALFELEQRKQALDIKIVELKRLIEKETALRGGLCARTIGESVMRLADAGRIDVELLRIVKEDLLVHVKSGSKRANALQGTVFDLTDLDKTPAAVANSGDSTECLSAEVSDDDCNV